MAQLLRVLHALTEDLSWVPGTQVEWLPTTYNSSSMGWRPLSDPASSFAHICTDTQTYSHNLNYFLEIDLHYEALTGL